MNYYPVKLLRIRQEGSFRIAAPDCYVERTEDCYAVGGRLSGRSFARNV